MLCGSVALSIDGSMMMGHVGVRLRLGVAFFFRSHVPGTISDAGGRF